MSGMCYKRRKIAIAMICVCMLFLTGCGRGIGGSGPKAEKKNSAAKEKDTGNAEKSMGRYLEKEITAPEEVLSREGFRFPDPHLQKSESDALILGEQLTGIYTSDDKGESWEAKGNPWINICNTSYIADFALSPEGAAALIYAPYDDDTAEDEDRAESTGDAGTEEGKEDSADIGTEDEEKWKYAYIDADGILTEIALSLPEGEQLRGLGFDRQGGLYGYGRGVFYRIDWTTGIKKELFRFEGIMDAACFTERYLVGFTTRGEVVIYDLAQEMRAEEDKVLQDFISENLGMSIGNTDRGHAVIAAGGEQEDIVYFAYSGGLYRHVIGGTAIEQIIDGAVSSFGDPSMRLTDMVMLPDNEFVVAYFGGELYRYSYDPNVPTVPDKQLRVYSLAENYSMRQAVSLFQKKHPDIFIRYEIGMSGKDGVTREDAVRNLNTKIMSGEGPDILLLDGLPQTSYEEKGILADVSGAVEGMSGENALFPNIVEACRKDGKIYALPIRIQLAMMAGDAESIQNIKDITSLADEAERLRKENSEGPLTGLRSEEQLLYVLGLTSSAAWTDKKGDIDEAALEEFLAAASRIWQAEISGVGEDWLKEERDFTDSFAGEGSYYATASTSAISVAMEERKLALGKVYRVDFDYAVLTSIAELTEEFKFDIWEGQVKDGFIPDGMAGIAASAAKDELAMEFFEFLFGKELQDMDLSGGLPVNMASFDTFAKNPRAGLAGDDERGSGGIAISSSDGSSIFTLEVKWPLTKEFQKLKQAAGAACRISIGDAAIEQAVCEIGPKALDGDISPQEAVREIVKKSAIYLAE